MTTLRISAETDYISSDTPSRPFYENIIKKFGLSKTSFDSISWLS